MSRSLINTSLFMSHSQESKHEAGSGTSYTETDRISEPTNDDCNYEKISDEEDLYIIRTADKKYHLYRQRLINTVKELHSYATVQISQLEKEQAKLLESTMEATRILYNSKVLKKLILDDIQQIFKDVKNPRPGSVAAFFLACFNKDNFQGPLGCNPRCAASSMGCEHFDCADTILVYSNREFNALNDKHTEHAYIYIESDKFNHFTPQCIQKLRDANIFSVTMIYGDATGSYKEVSYKLSLDQLPVGTKKQSTTSAGGIIFVILLIIMVFTLVFLYGNGYMDGVFNF